MAPIPRRSRRRPHDCAARRLTLTTPIPGAAALVMGLTRRPGDVGPEKRSLCPVRVFQGLPVPWSPDAA